MLVINNILLHKFVLEIGVIMIIFNKLFTFKLGAVKAINYQIKNLFGFKTTNLVQNTI